MEKRHYANASNHSSINQQPIHQQSLNPLGHLSSPFSINESVPIQSSTPQSANQSSTSQSQSAFERHTALSSSSLYNFSHIESTRSPTLSLDENLYRGIDLSSAVFQIPHQSRASNVPSLDDFDSFQARQKSTEPAQSNLVKKDLSRQPLGMVSSISSYLSSFTSSFTSPSQPEVPRLVLQSAPAFVEQYTSFYSRASADSLVDCIRSYLTFKSIDFEFNHEKAKFCVLFLCPVFTSLSIAFNIRLYSSPKDSNLILCEVQRRDGCSMGFNYVYTSLMNHVKQRQMFSMPFTACPLSSLPNNQPHSVNDVQTLDLPMTLDDQSFNCLVSFVSAGDCVQQSEAVRIIGQCLSSSSGAQMMPRLPALVEVLRSSLTYHPVNSQRSLDEEKAAQITHLVSMLLSTNSRSCSLDPALALRLVPSLTNLLATVVADINLKRLKIVRFILETLNSLTVDHESVNAVKHTFTQRDLEVLRHCSHVKDTEVVRLASVVSQRLATS